MAASERSVRECAHSDVPVSEESGRLHEAHYQAAIRRSLIAARESLPVADDAEVAEATCRQLLQLGAEEHPGWLAVHPQAASLSACQLLIEQSETQRDTDAAAMLAAARAAVACAEALPFTGRLAALTADMRAEAWGALANSLKVRGALREAEEAWSRAQFHLVFGSGDPMLKAKLLALKGSLRIEQRRLRQAIELLKEAQQLQASISDPQQEAKTLLVLSRAYWLADRLEDAIVTVVTAAGRADGEKDPLLKLYALHNLALYLEEAGQTQVAMAILGRSEMLYEEAAGPLLKLRKRWVEGRLLARLGQLEEAVSILDSVRQRFADLGLAFDAAQAALDLAVFYAQLGKMREVEQLATEMYPVFVSRDIPREATAALLLFAEAARAHTATVASITQVAERLKRIQSRKG